MGHCILLRSDPFTAFAALASQFPAHACSPSFPSRDCTRRSERKTRWRRRMRAIALRALLFRRGRGFSSSGAAPWSMKKDPALEAALSRNRRWIVNNQLKNIILHSPDGVATVQSIQKRFKTLDLQGKALNWLRKYPCCFDVFSSNDGGGGELLCRLTKRMNALVEEEESVRDACEPAMAEKLARLLMMSVNRRINAVKLAELKRNFGFPDDYLIRIIPKYPEMFKIVNHTGRRNNLEIELASWNPDFAISIVEAGAMTQGKAPAFQGFLPENWGKSLDRFRKFNSSPYVSPYADVGELGEKEMEKRAVGLIHELLSLTLWKKASIIKLGHFRREFALPEKLGLFLMKHPAIFYVSNRYRIHTVVLREGYSGSELIDKDPLVVVKEKFGELMQEGLHEYNRRRHAENLEKKQKKGLLSAGSGREGSVIQSQWKEPDEWKKGLYKEEETRSFLRDLSGNLP